MCLWWDLLQCSMGVLLRAIIGNTHCHLQTGLSLSHFVNAAVLSNDIKLLVLPLGRRPEQDIKLLSLPLGRRPRHDMKRLVCPMDELLSMTRKGSLALWAIS